MSLADFAEFQGIKKVWKPSHIPRELTSSCYKGLQPANNRQKNVVGLFEQCY